MQLFVGQLPSGGKGAQVFINRCEIFYCVDLFLLVNKFHMQKFSVKILQKMEIL